jgi:two-component system response regulator
MNNKILLIDDSHEDVELAMRALGKRNLANGLIHFEDGQLALDYIFDEDNPLPALILLDLHMPKVDGFDVVRALRSNDRTRLMPVIVMMSSSEDRNVIDAYHLDVNAYLVKPIIFDEFFKVIPSVGLYWSVTTPPGI